MPRPVTQHPCHQCNTEATHHKIREATVDEARAYHQAMDEWRAANGLPPMPADAGIKQAPVTVPVYGCDKHPVSTS